MRTPFLCRGLTSASFNLLGNVHIEIQLLKLLYSKEQKNEELSLIILNRHKTFLLTNSLELSNKNNKLPFLYLTAKTHKTPTSSRFITSGKFSSLSELSEKVGLCLKMLLVCASRCFLYAPEIIRAMKASMRNTKRNISLLTKFGCHEIFGKK